MKIEIKNYLGEIIYSHEQENNTLKITVEKAVEAETNLSDADLSDADLSYANLSDANLNCIGDMKFIFSMQIDYWNVCFIEDILQIGCQKHSINEWKNFSDEKISQMHSKALEWWKRWKQPLFAIIDERLKDAN